MRKHKKQVKQKFNIRNSFSKTTLQFFIYTAELVLLFFVLSILVTDMYGEESHKGVVETADSEVKTLPQDVRNRIEDKVYLEKVRVPILMYHYVEYIKDINDTFRVSLNIEPFILEEQIRTLREADFTFITMGELSDVLDGKIPLPKKPVVLTFDDGHWDLYTDVLPILKKYNVKATAYIIPGFLGGSDFLSKDQLRNLIDSGFIEIGAHTMNHLSLPDISMEEMRYEIVYSRKMLEDEFGIKVHTFAYPNGAFNQEVVEIVEGNGYLLAVSTIPGIEQSDENRYFLSRLRPGRRVGEEFLSWLDQNSFQAFQ